MTAKPPTRTWTSALAGLVAAAAACVSPLPGGPYEAPGARGAAGVGAGGAGAGAASAGAGGSLGSTGSAATAGGGAATGAGAATGGGAATGAGGRASCGNPLVVNVFPSETWPVSAGARFPFEVSVEDPNIPGCPTTAPPRPLDVRCSSPDPRLLLEPDGLPWFAMPLYPLQPQYARLVVSSASGTPAGRYDFTCSNGSPAESATATYVVGTAPPMAAQTCGANPPTTEANIFARPAAPYTFAAAGLTPPTVTGPGPGGSQPFQVTAAPGVVTDPFQATVGFGFRFVIPPCVDASLFAGVRFTVAGDLGTCGLWFSVLTSEDDSVFSSGSGTCTEQVCSSPTSGPLSIGTTSVSFAAMSGGTPMSTVDWKALVGVAWTLLVPTDGTRAPCVADLTISDVSFVP